MAPRADQRRQARNGADRVASAPDALHAVVDANGGGLDRSEVARKPGHLRSLDAAGLRGALRRPFGCARRELRESQRVPVDIVAVDQVFRNEYVHHAQSQRAVGSRQQRDVLVAFFRCGAAIGIDGDQLRAAALGLLRARPEVQVGRHCVAAPDDDQAAVLELLDVHAHGRADGGAPARFSGGRADRAVEQRRAEAVEEPAVHRRPLQQAHRSRIAVRHNRLRPVVGPCYFGKPGRDRREGFVPSDAGETAFTLYPDPFHRMQQALVGIGTIEVAGDLGAEHACRRGMVRRAPYFDRAAVLDRSQ